MADKELLDKEVLKTVSRIELSVRGTLDTVMTDFLCAARSTP